jgi:transposase
MVRGTKTDDVVWVLNKLPRSLRLKVTEITLDLSPSMKLIAKRAFPNATQVSDRFYVQRLMNEAVLRPSGRLSLASDRPGELHV